MHFDVDSNILSIELGPEVIVDTKVIGNIIVHISKLGKPVLVEILDASKFLGSKEKFELPNLQSLLGEA